jgi:stress-induced-phosphoprotein 1
VSYPLDTLLRLGPNASLEGAPFGDPTGGIGQMFYDPNLLQKLAKNPKTSSYLADPSFVASLQAIQKNPKNAPNLFSDPRMIQVLGVLMGVDMEMRDTPPDVAGASGSKVEAEEDVQMSDAPPAKKPEPAKKAPSPEPEPEEEDEEAIEKKKAKEAADKEKALGTACYKKREFDEAIKHYQAAWDLHKDITYLNNLGAAYFEKGDYQACIDTCTKAVEEGRELYADFKIIAKSYARIGTAYEKQGDLTQAIDYYNMSLREHRTPEVLNKVRTAERNKIEAAKKSYIDPVKAEEAREEGNKKFKESDWPGAVEAYSEMIKRAPEDPRGYSNRAAAFIKLFEFPSALDDCDLAIKKDPKFIRAYIRKAQAYFGMREYSKSVDACNQALEVDKEHHNGTNSREIEQQQQKAFTAMYAARENETEEQTRERLLRDPEVGLPSTEVLRQRTNTPVDYGHHARSCDAGHPATGTIRPRGVG